LWNYEVSNYSDGTNATTTEPVIVAIYSENGRGITNIQNKYLVSSVNNITKETIKDYTWHDSPSEAGETDETNKYLWNYEIITYTDGPVDSDPAIIGTHGEQGYGIVANVVRDAFTESNWSTYGTIGREEVWGGTSDTRNGCRINDLFTVTGTATDSGKGHTLTFKSTTASGNLKGKCISHVIAERGAQGI
jgi:hypothetical protein